MRTCLCNTRASSYPDDDGLARNGTEILLSCYTGAGAYTSAAPTVKSSEWNGGITKAAAAEFAFLLRPAAPPCGYGLPYPASRDKQIPMAN